MLAGACAGDEEKPGAETCGKPAAPVATPVPGDANGDGHVDVSDGMWMERAVFSGGPQPVCLAAADIDPDGHIDALDGFALWNDLGPGASDWRPTLADGACEAFERDDGDACGDGLALGIATGTNSATVTLTNPGLDAEAWSFGVTASGCTIASATFAGTRAADLRDDPPGVRDGGFAWIAQPDASTAVTMLVVDWRRDHTLAASSEAQPVLSLQLAADACGTCTLSVVSGAMGPGGAIEAVVSAGGLRFEPTLGTATVEVCPG